MSNTRKSRQKAGGRWQWAGVRLSPRTVVMSRRVACCLLLTAFCLLSFGCRMDMQDQPRYEYYEPGDRKFFPDGASSRATVEGTVPRQAGQYRDREDYLYTGKAAGVGAAVSGQPGAGAQSGAPSGGVGAAVPSMQTGMASGALAGASTNVRGNVSGGAPGAREATTTG